MRDYAPTCGRSLSPRALNSPADVRRPDRRRNRVQPDIFVVRLVDRNRPPYPNARTIARWRSCEESAELLRDAPRVALGRYAVALHDRSARTLRRRAWLNGLGARGLPLPATGGTAMARKKSTKRPA